MKVCRICLSKDGRLYPITSNGLRSLYQQLTGVLKLEMNVEGRLPQWVCAECGLRLLSYNKLRQKGRRAHQILCELLDEASYITEEDINEKERENNQLKSNLSYTVLDYIEIPDNHLIQEDDSIGNLDVTNPKPTVKIEEFVDIDIDVGNTASYFKIEHDSNSSNSFSDTAVFKAENNSDLESDSHSSVSKKKRLKTKDKKLSLNVKRQVDKYLYLFNENTGNVIKGVTKKSGVFAKKADNKKNVTKTVENLVKKDNVRNKNKDENLEQVSIDDYFNVQILSLDEQKVHVDKRKYSLKYTNSRFKCNHCYKGFMNEVAYTRHRFHHSEKRGQYQCKICKIRFRIQTSFYHHTMSHKYVYNCKKCDFSCHTKSTAIQHKSKHKGKVYKCQHCNVEFSLSTTYLSHLRIKHVSKFVCELCGYSFVSAKGVELHRNLKHSHDKDSKRVSADGPTCATCNIRFVTDEALKTHLRVSHSKLIRNDYEYPGTASSVICELCGVKVAGGRQYRTHFRRYHPTNKQTLLPVRALPDQTSVCEQCGKVFKYKCNLQKHALLHTGQKPFQCDYCSKRFATKPLIHSHIVNCHLPKKNEPKERFPCSICGKEFANSGNRVRHMVIHSDLRPFSCEVCGSSFKTKGEVKAHTTHVHLKVPWPKKHARSTGQGGVQYL